MIRHRTTRTTAVTTFLVALGALLGACDSGVPVPVVVDDREGDPPAPAARVWYVAPDGDDADSGTFLRPWRTVTRGVLGLQRGETLVLRGGTYFESEIRVLADGTAAQPITIRSHPGETAVIDGGLRPFRSAPNQDWEPVQPGLQLYRSTATFADVDRVFGYLTDADGGHQLVPYEDLAPLSSTLEDYSETAPYYAGPGLHWDATDGRIYVRLAHGRYQTRLNLLVPPNADPRANELIVFSGASVLRLDGASHLVFEDVHLRHGNQMVHIAGDCHDIVFRDCTFRGGRYHLVARDRARYLLLERCTFDGGFPPWVARSDVKRPASSAPAHSMQGAGVFLEGTVDEVEIDSCLFRNLFDAIDAIDRPTDVEIHGCAFHRIRDDVLQLGSAGHRVEFHHNLLVEVAAAVSWHGSGAPPPDAIGTKYVHHNVIDTSVRQLYGRDDPLGLLEPSWRGPAGDGMATGPAFGLHDTALLTGPDPWKVYHNTIVGAEDVDGHGSGASYRFAPFTPAEPHEVYNNIFVHTGDQPIVFDARCDDGAQVFDGNLYFRSHPGPTSRLLEEYSAGAVLLDFAALQAFRSSSLWAATRLHYPPGWEAAGVEGDPGLDAIYRPDPAGPGATGALDLSGRGWPDTAPVPWRGAFPPR